MLRRTSGQPSGLQVLNSFGMGAGLFHSIAASRPGPACPPLGYRSETQSRPRPARALTTLQPGQELPFSQARRRDCTPPPQLLLHLFQEPQDAQKIGTGQGVFSLQNLRGMKGGEGHRSREQKPSSLNESPLGMQLGRMRVHLITQKNPGHFLGPEG